ncbi:hypothetical protein ATANTOWER_007282 [Ataeniobius toweri]|uniref:Uncharacterized protein n=1 Tax=Ataeniobius toweri TaxID=208326 RepID=A0ABU7A5J1_9TELE|nr:hypothetical protein [Ataeniobius toweri]
MQYSFVYTETTRLHLIFSVLLPGGAGEGTGALPLDPTELTRDLKNRSEPSLKWNLQADSSVSHQRSEFCPPSQHLLSAPSQRTRRSRRATLFYTTESMTIPPGGFPCAYLQTVPALFPVPRIICLNIHSLISSVSGCSLHVGQIQLWGHTFLIGCLETAEKQPCHWTSRELQANQMLMRPTCNI